MILLSTLAWADGASIDIEVLSLAAAPDALPGIVPARTFARGVGAVAVQAQYEVEPLVLYLGDTSLGPIIGKRLDLQLAASYGVTRWFAAQLVMPVSWDWDSDHPRMTTQGFGGGMGRLGVRASPIQGRFGAIAASVMVAVPVASPGTWRGDEQPTITPALAGTIDLDRISGMASLSAIVREPVTTEYGLTADTELAYAWGVRAEIARERAWVWGDSIVRVVPAQLAAGTGAWEILLGVSARVDPVRIDTFVGRGAAIGPGSTQIRAGVSLTLAGVIWSPTSREPVRFAAPEDIPDEVQRVDVTGPDKGPSWRTGELARIEADAIVIREPIQFEYATNHILPESRPTLTAVAKILHDHAEILHVIIEGHASVEGTDAYNYTLADSRAAAVWEALVDSGVHPDRISLRSLGESRPVDFGNTELALATNRRVEFHIVRRLRPGEVAPTYVPLPRPWDGRPWDRR